MRDALRECLLMLCHHSSLWKLIIRIDRSFRSPLWVSRNNFNELHSWQSLELTGGRFKKKKNQGTQLGAWNDAGGRRNIHSRGRERRRVCFIAEDSFLPFIYPTNIYISNILLTLLLPALSQEFPKGTLVTLDKWQVFRPAVPHARHCQMKCATLHFIFFYFKGKKFSWVLPFCL